MKSGNFLFEAWTRTSFSFQQEFFVSNNFGNLEIFFYSELIKLVYFFCIIIFFTELLIFWKLWLDWSPAALYYELLIAIWDEPPLIANDWVLIITCNHIFCTIVSFEYEIENMRSLTQFA